MKKYLFLMFCLVACGAVAFASIHPPDCVCEITAKVLSIKTSKANGYDGRRVTVFNMVIEIINVGAMVKEGYSPEMTCAQYQVGEKIPKTHTIKEYDFVNKDALIKTGTTIKAHIQRAGDGPRVWHNLSQIEVIQQ